jgi:hypothetical protein
MRAAALALVLICGAAVILWYGNMLNSWVLGGLVGGLAALLLSIPISLALFSYLSRRHDEQRKAVTQEKMSLAQMAYYKRTPVEVLESSAYASQEEEEDAWSKGNSHYHVSTTRNLPAPSSSRLPAKRQSQQAPLAARQRMTDYTLARQQQQGAVSSNRNGQRQGQEYYPGAYGYQSNSLRGTQQTAALRTARQEAARQGNDHDTDTYSSGPLKRLSTGRSEEHSSNPQIVSRQFQTPISRQYLPKPMVDGPATPSNGGRIGIERANSRSLLASGQHAVAGEPHTDKLRTRQSNQASAAMRQQQQQMGQTSRHPRVETQSRNPEIVTGSLKNPMTRRAPYMYEDDPLREQLAQQLDPPSVRRSSLYEEYEDDDDYGDETD